MLGRFLLLVAAVSMAFPSDVTASCSWRRDTCEKCLEDDRCFWYVGNNTCYALPEGKTYPGPEFYWDSRWANNCIFDSWAFLVAMLVITGVWGLGVLCCLCSAVAVCCGDDDEEKKQSIELLAYGTFWPCVLIVGIALVVIVVAAGLFAGALVVAAGALACALACVCAPFAAAGSDGGGYTSLSGGSSAVVGVVAVQTTV